MPIGDMQATRIGSVPDGSRPAGCKRLSARSRHPDGGTNDALWIDACCVTLQTAVPATAPDWMLASGAGRTEAEICCCWIRQRFTVYFLRHWRIKETVW